MAERESTKRPTLGAQVASRAAQIPNDVLLACLDALLVVAAYTVVLVVRSTERCR